MVQPHPLNCRCTFVEDDGYECRERNYTTMRKMHLSLAEELQIGKALLPRAEEWSGVELATNNVYGIRRYTRGAWLAAHTDHAGNPINLKCSDWPVSVF